MPDPSVSQSERPQDKLKDIGPIARLLGAKWVRRDDRMAILKVPRWLPESVLEGVIETIKEDYRFVYPDATPVITRQGRFVRFSWRAG